MRSTSSHSWSRRRARSRSRSGRTAPCSLDNGWVTLQEVLAGFALSVVAGVAFAVVLHLSPTLRRAFYPLLVASQTVPIVVIAPILVVWLGFGIGPKLVIIALICFFPITVNTLDGLRSVDPDLVKMMRTLDASRWQTLRRVEAPTALPYFFSGAKIAVAVAVIGAVFGEWAGSSSGLGHLIQQASAQLQTARTFAAVVVLSALAIVLFALLAVIERRVAWWGPRWNREPDHDDQRRTVDQRRSEVSFAPSPWPWWCARRRSPPGAARSPSARPPGKPQPFDLALDFYVNPDHAGIFEALDRGYFRDAGLDVQPQVPSDPSAPIKEVAGGTRGPRDLLRARGPARARPGPAREGGRRAGAHPADVADLAQGLGHQGRQGPARQDDRHRRASPTRQAYLKTILDKRRPQHERRQHRRRPAGPAARDPLGGRADAMLGGFLNVEGVDLKLRGKDPTVIPVDRLGIPTYNELVLVANSDELATPSRRTSGSSWPRCSAAPRRPSPIRPARPRTILDAGKGLDPRTTAAEVRKTLPLLTRAGKHPYGYMDPKQWTRFAQFFADHGVIKALPADRRRADERLPARTGFRRQSARCHDQRSARPAMADAAVGAQAASAAAGPWRPPGGARRGRTRRRGRGTAHRGRRTPPPPRRSRGGRGRRGGRPA